MSKKSFLAIALCSTLLILFSSCNKDTKEEEVAAVPFTSVTATCAGETATGVIQTDGKNILFTFNAAEDFTSATLAVVVNKGWTLTFPTSLTGVNLGSTDAVLNFSKDKDGTVAKYWMQCTANSLPIINANKIQIDGLNAGEAITLDNGSKTVSIKYDQAKMDWKSVKLIFNDGALQTGATLPDDLDFDFSDGLSQPLVIGLGGDREYTLKLDVTSYMKFTPVQKGFTDETSNYLSTTDYPYIHVYGTDQILDMPMFTLPSSVKGCFWGPSNPYEWDGGLDTDYDENGKYRFSDDVWSYPGNWAADRQTMSSFGRVAIVTIDQEKVNVNLASNSSKQVKFGDFNNLVVSTGFVAIHSMNYNVYDEGKFINRYLDKDGLDSPAWRACVGVDNNNKLQFAMAAVKSGDEKLYTVPFQSDWQAEGSNLAADATDIWNVKDAAWAIPWALRDGKLMKVVELIQNDGSLWSDALGHGWQNFYNAHCLLGITYDNKIAIMVNANGGDYWDGAHVNNDDMSAGASGGYCKGYSLPQLIWLASQLGWREAICIGNDSEETKSYNFIPEIKVNGKAVLTEANGTTNCADGNTKYANNGADIVTSYCLTFDAK